MQNDSKCPKIYRILFRGVKVGLDFYFSDIDVSWLKAYESWLIEQKLAENTVGIRFRTLRVIYNIAITEGLVKNDCYPFRKYKVSKLHKSTAKRAITKEQVKQIMEYNMFQVAWLTYLVNDYKVSAEWLLTGNGSFFIIGWNGDSVKNLQKTCKEK